MTGDPLTLLEELVAFPTVAGEPNGDLIGYVRARLAGIGVDATVMPSATRADGINLHAVLGPVDRPGILLSAHTDVVAVDGQPWRTDPFRLTRIGDRLHGRGSADMKGFIAALLAVLPYAAERPLRRPLHVALSCDEELGCLGVGSLLDRLASDRPALELCIVGEPTELRVADRHKGKLAWRVELHGRAGHSSTARSAVNAVTCAARLITAIDDLGGELADRPEHRDGAFTVPHATLSVGPIRGGVATNIVPDRCWFEFELRYLPGQDPVPIVDRIRHVAASLESEMQALAPEARVALHELTAYPPLSPPRVPATVPWADAAAAPLAVDFGTEAGLYRERLGVPVVICGPGDMAQAHRADEYLELSQLLGAERLLRAVVDRLREL